MRFLMLITKNCWGFVDCFKYCLNLRQTLGSRRLVFAAFRERLMKNIYLFLMDMTKLDSYEIKSWKTSLINESRKWAICPKFVFLMQNIQTTIFPSYRHYMMVENICQSLL